MADDAPSGKTLLILPTSIVNELAELGHVYLHEHAIFLAHDTPDGLWNIVKDKSGGTFANCCLDLVLRQVKFVALFV